MEDKTKETYTIRIFCSNCGYGKSTDGYITKIPKEITVNNFLRSEMCPNCGCNNLSEKLGINY